METRAFRRAPAGSRAVTAARGLEKADALAEVEEAMVELVGRIRSDTREAAIAIDTSLQPFGLKILRVIAHRGPLQSGALALALSVDRSVISRQVTQLCELGLATLQSVEGDGRARLVAATPRAIERLEELRIGGWSLVSHLEEWEVGDIRDLTRLLSKLNAR